VLAGVTSAEQGAGLEALWGAVGGLLSRIPDADVIADCGRIGVDGSHYDLLAEADAVVLITRSSLAEVVRLRDRIVALTNALHRRGRPGARVGVVVVADHKNFKTDIAEVGQAIGHGRGPATVIGGLAHEPKSADQLRGQWGGKLDKSLLIRTAREIAGYLSAQLSAAQLPAAQQPAGQQPIRQQPGRQQSGRQESGRQESGRQGSPPQGGAGRQFRPGPGAARDLTGREPTPSTGSGEAGSGEPGPEYPPSRASGVTGHHSVPPEIPRAGLAEPARQMTPAPDPLYAAPVPDTQLPDLSPPPGPVPRGRHAGPPAAPAVGTERPDVGTERPDIRTERPDIGTERKAPDRRRTLFDSPSTTVSGGPATQPGDQGGW